MAKNPAERFRDEMKKLGVGVTISSGGRPPVVITAWLCPDCRAERKNLSMENKTGVPCENCGSDKAAILE